MDSALLTPDNQYDLTTPLLLLRTQRLEAQIVLRQATTVMAGIYARSWDKKSNGGVTRTLVFLSKFQRSYDDHSTTTGGDLSSGNHVNMDRTSLRSSDY